MHKIQRVSIWLFIWIIILTNTPALPVHAQESAEQTVEFGAEYSSGEVIVLLREGVGWSDIKDDMDQIDGIESDYVSNEDILFEQFMVMKLTGDNDVEEVIDELSQLPEVAFVQPNFIYRHLEDTLEALAYQANDPLNQYLWFLDGFRLEDTWSLAKTNHAVSIAVLDSGIYSEHEDLKDNIIPDTFLETKTGSTVPNALTPHGTHVAGIAAAVADNNVGIAGVSYNARIVPINIFYPDGENPGKYISDTAELLKAFDYILGTEDNGKSFAQNHNLRVINMSIGDYAFDSSEGSRDLAFEQAVNRAFDQGILSVAASGNGKTDQLMYPAAFPNCLSVGAVTGLDDWGDLLPQVQFAYEYSNFGFNDITAPGSDMLSTWVQAPWYNMLSGTSMAAPFVSGIAALLFSINPDLTPAEVRSFILATAADLGDPGFDPYYGWGVIEPYLAVDAVIQDMNKIPGNVQNVIDQIQLLPDPGGIINREGVTKVAEATLALAALTAAENAMIPAATLEKLTKAQEQAGKINHTYGAVTIFGADGKPLLWNIQVVLKLIGPEHPEHGAFLVGLEADDMLFVLYHISLVDILTGMTCQPAPGETIMMQIGDLDLLNGQVVWVIHQKGDGNFERFELKVEEGKITIPASSFSLYGIATKASVPPESEHPKPEQSEPSAPAAQSVPTTKAVNTGDFGGISLWTVLGMAALAGILAAYQIRRIRKEK